MPALSFPATHFLLKAHDSLLCSKHWRALQYYAGGPF